MKSINPKWITTPLKDDKGRVLTYATFNLDTGKLRDFNTLKEARDFIRGNK